MPNQIDVCDHVHVVRGQCLREPNHEGEHFYRDDIATLHAIAYKLGIKTQDLPGSLGSQIIDSIDMLRGII